MTNHKHLFINILKWMSILMGAILLLAYGALFYVEAFINPDIDKIFGNGSISYEIEKIPHQSGNIRTIMAGNPDSENLILFVHGAPGSWADFSSYFTDTILTSRATLVSFDRPGYGGSLLNGKMPSIFDQVLIAEKILSKYEQKNIIVVGYSYGGPIAGILTARNPHLVNHLLLLAPVNHPDHEPIFWFNYLIDHPIIRFLLPEYIVRANDEKLTHARDLNEVRSRWQSIRANTVHMHCTDDWIAPFEPNTRFSQENISKDILQIITWEGDNHFLPNHVKERIMPVLFEMVGNLN